MSNVFLLKIEKSEKTQLKINNVMNQSQNVGKRKIGKKSKKRKHFEDFCSNNKTYNLTENLSLNFFRNLVPTL